MSDPKPANAPPEPNPPAPPTDPPAHPPTDPPADPPEKWDYERGMATIAKLRDEVRAAKADAKRAAELEAKLKEYEEKELTERDKLERKISELEARDADRAAREQETRLRLAVYGLRDELGLADSDLALAALDRAALTYGDDGEPENLAEALAALLDAKPLLRGKPAAQKPPGTNAGDGSGDQPPPPLTAEQLAWADRLGMTPERYAAFKTASTVDEFAALQAQPPPAA